MPKKKDRVITLRVSEDDFNIVESFAKAKGLSVSAYINSVIKSQTEYFIPTASNQKVSIPNIWQQQGEFRRPSKSLGDRTRACYSSYMGRNKFAYFTGCHLQNI